MVFRCPIPATQTIYKVDLEASSSQGLVKPHAVVIQHSHTPLQLSLSYCDAILLQCNKGMLTCPSLMFISHLMQYNFKVKSRFTNNFPLHVKQQNEWIKKEENTTTG